jgi:hypothetical protein
MTPQHQHTASRALRASIAKYNREKEEKYSDGRVYACAHDDDGRIIYMQELIMESHLGRKLSPNEKVGFKNGDSLDCRGSNLFLITLDS